MTLMPSNIVTLARATLLVSAPAAVVLFLAPASSLPPVLNISSGVAHAAVFYGLTAVAFVAFPRLRRSDMAGVSLVMGGMIELVQLATGGSARMSDWLAAVAGVAALYVPTVLEQMRHMARKHAYTTFSDLAANDRRKRAKRKPVVAASAVDRFSPHG